MVPGPHTEEMLGGHSGGSDGLERRGPLRGDGSCLMEGVGLGASLDSLDPVGKWRPHGAIIHQIGGSQLEAVCRLATPADILIFVAAKGTTNICWVRPRKLLDILQGWKDSGEC